MEDEPIKILLVEDTPGDVAMLEHNLRQVRNAQFKLSHVGQLKEMAPMLGTADFDVLVLDMNLPDSRGLNTVTTAILQAPWIPIVVLTSVGNEASGMEAVRSGAQDYLIKGEVDGWLLVRTIRYAIERKRAQKELECSLALAGAAQRAMLPARCPPQWTHISAAARNRTRNCIGGDFYDFIDVNEDQFVVVMGDVMGHDVRSALLMAQILGVLRSAQGGHTARIVSELNRTLMALGEKLDMAMTCSLVYALFDVPSDSLLFSNAGHPAPCLCDRRTGETTLLSPNEMILGVEGFEPVEMCQAFGPGARLVFFTDGILDACNSSGERFGEMRLEEAVHKHVARDPEGVADGILAEVTQFRQGTPQVDDESVVVVDRM